MRRDSRSPEAEAYRRLYKDKRWRGKAGVRARQLAKQPLCEMCLKASRITRATVCDHVDPKRKETEEGFFKGPFQSLCDQEPFRCHSSRKQREERLGYEPGCDPSGRPIDPNHPWNRRG
jgi:5-methylcytosine-specific restriction protein A